MAGKNDTNTGRRAAQVVLDRFAVLLPLAALLLFAAKWTDRLPELSWAWVFAPLFLPFALRSLVAVLLALVLGAGLLSGRIQLPPSS